MKTEEEMVADLISKTTATQEKINGLGKFLQEGVTNIVTNNKTDGIAPVVAVLCYDPINDREECRLHMIDTGFNDPLEKKLSMKTVAAAVFKAKLFPIAAGVSSEAWVEMCTDKDSYEDNRKKYLRVADNPNKKEVAIVAIQATHRQEGPPLSYHNMRYLKRDNENYVQWDGDWQKGEEGGSVESGLLDHFFYGYAKFAYKQEDPDSYLHGKKVVQLDRR